mgnify:CR=1 FL=1
MTTIETARKLLAGASPELRMIVSMCIADANFTGYRIAQTAFLIDGEEKKEIQKQDKEWLDFARELIGGSDV